MGIANKWGGQTLGSWDALFYISWGAGTRKLQGKAFVMGRGGQETEIHF